ncbi:MAG: TVP38/TMEM64 family protein [Haliea sp.]|nr:TVP38/TMEM64 family protein [Haliea sp.]
MQRNIIVVGLAILAAGLIAASDALHDGTGEIIAWMQGTISQAPLLGIVGFVLLAMISAMIAFFSSAVLAPVAILAWGKPATLALLWLGWLLGGIASFCIGRFLGRSVAATLIGETKIAAWEGFVNQRTRFLHILLFQAAVPSEIPGYLLGILHYRFLLYLIALAITELPYAIAVVYLGDSFLEGESSILMVAGGAAVLLGTLIYLLAGRTLRK